MSSFTLQCQTCAIKAPSARCSECPTTTASNYGCPSCPESELQLTLGWLHCLTCHFLQSAERYEAKLQQRAKDRESREIEKLLREDARRGDKTKSSSRNKHRDDKLSSFSTSASNSFDDEVFAARMRAPEPPRTDRLNVRAEAQTIEVEAAISAIVDEFIEQNLPSSPAK